MKGFMFYDNYYYLIKVLDKKKQQIMSLAIIDYMFGNIEPDFSNDIQLNGIWMNIKMPLDKSKKQSKNVQKMWNDKDTTLDTKLDTKTDTNNNTKLNTKKDTKRDTNNISTFYFLISNFIFNNNFNNNTKLILEEWIKYKFERKEKYTETGFNKLLTQIKNGIAKYGEDRMKDTIEYSMANNYKGILFDRLKREQQDKYQGLSFKEREQLRKEEEWKKIEEEFLKGE